MKKIISITSTLCVVGLLLYGCSPRATTRKDTIDIAPASSSSSSAGVDLITYTNTEHGYSIQIPSDWTIEEDTLASDYIMEKVNARGTNITANNGDYVFAGVTDTCPDLSKNFEPTPNPSSGKTLTIHGREFQSATGESHAMGMYDTTIYYASPKDGSGCYVLYSYTLRSSPGHGKPEMGEEEIARIKQFYETRDREFEDIIHSFRVLK